MMTKKMLVQFVEGKSSGQGKNFVVPINDGTENKFVSLPKLELTTHGLVVYVGRELAAEDVLLKIIDSGVKILPSVDDQMNQIRDYLEVVSSFKIGDVVLLNFNKDGKPMAEKQPISPFAGPNRRLP